ncbi:TonB-dependent receptor [Winogradskyella sediminis]|uniref:Outer membrane receptor proteins, mostly Fe transport n=1 Tax=Winogradskyella sediminis TaxID=1382466 RepID=A0A1H1R2N6_9FLAO|nr:carboxypeptidase-like regulatory domain-containing protein [Winogradskyella sediminis]REG89635.1 outer membrane receptor protein involved in Fe transport [Winogradskyella sediminis]SDS29963.1 Outer membrane receptor proteins, mostly Fe transport [Winogradskyella sediminis]
MKKFSLFLCTVVLTSLATFAYAQSTITGKIIDSDMNSALPGANIIEKGTTNGTTTDFEGTFTLTTNSSSGEVVISYVGYVTQTIAFNGDTDLGTITLMSSNVGLDEILLVASVAVDRKTPVAVSTIKAEEIAIKLGTQEFPEILKTTPGVYVTRQGGGYGDSRINLRGFSSENVAVMINGVPVNDMENGAVYWSNWAGLGDVTSTMQVQRGLGASKVAVNSVGGTINIITKTTDAEQGGQFGATLGNDGYTKYGMTYSTGLSDKGFAATVSAAKLYGDGYVDGTEFSGYNYFLSLSQQINDAHRLSFTAFGAQQQHGQRYNRSTIAELKDTDSGPQKANKDWGYKNGEVYHQSYNFYHKPQLSINHLWNINDQSSLSTAAYASFGTGGGRRDEGSKLGSDEYRLGSTGLTPIDFDKVVEENRANGVNGSTDILSASINNHEWYGILSSYKNRVNDQLTVSAGFDGRYYIGSHWYEVTDLLGGQFFLDNESDTFAFGQPLQVGDKYNKDYDGVVTRYGLFGQAEYQINESVNVFVAADVSNSIYKQKEYMNNTIVGSRESEAVDFLGYGVKGGGNYNLDMNNNVFVNVGYFSKAPFLDDVFLDEDNIIPNEEAVNEKVFSAELGYGFRGEKLSANVNVYYTQWLDKSLGGSIGTGESLFFYNLQGIDALHQGVEVDFRYSATDYLTVTGMVSIGDWQWKSNVSSEIRDQSGDVVDVVEVYAEDLKVGDVAQTTFALGVDYKLAAKSNIYIDYNFAGDNYSSYDVTNRGSNDLPDVWKLPDFGLFDVGLRHSFEMGSFNATLIGKVNNAFNTEYVSDANDLDGTAETAQVYFGPGRTYSVGLNVNF